jgi:hypothetical protein
MNVRKTLAQRREELVARSNRLRENTGMQVQAMHGSMATASVGASLLTTVKHNKLLLAGVALAIIVIKPRRIIAGLEIGLVAWQAWRNVGPVVQNFLKRSPEPR